MTLVAIDLDGTLLSDNGTISVENKHAIYDAQQHNHMIVISSGRSLHDTREILKQAEIECPIITGNGGLAYVSGNILQQLVIPTEKRIAIMNTIEQYGLYYEIYTNQGVLMMEKGDAIFRREIDQFEQHSDKAYARGKVNVQYAQHGLVYVSDFHTVDFSGLDPYKIFVMSFKSESLQALRSELTNMEDISLTTSGKEKLEIAHGQASKGNALEFIAEYFNVPLQDTCAIGDNLNDISMFNVAGTRIAMENAEQEVKEHADFITKHHNDHGVAHALRAYVL
ncbi:haloacid dehalogenase [Lentibacillus kapialis]|uniref:Haloacid dehalogenase n=1 Tax=Lentibacillus kapialis TaxID=340214 RepID=A0A917Q0K4_9BACI|nr:HAD family hydrolase [Lentibacillus kapialis]GGK03755.1 haloacid dehalogenase [Lentibacillus kapialis]